MGAFVWRGRDHGVPTPQPKQPQLALGIERQNEGLRLSWNRQAPIVRGARQATISIVDGDRRSQITLDAEQLANGAIVYWPSNSEVHFRRMDLLVDGSTVSESIWSIGSTPVNAQTPPAPTFPERITGKPSPMATATRRAEPPSGPASDESQSLGEPIRQKPVPTQESEITTPPTIAAEQQRLLAASPLPPAIASQTLLAKPSSPFVSVTTEPVKGSLPGRVIGKIPLLRRVRGSQDGVVPPKPIRRAIPGVPAELQRHVRGEVPVDVKVYVSEAGKVDFAELLSKSTGRERDLAGLAVYAARRWEFEPARSGNRKVPSELILRFRFGNTSLTKR
jgi:hypothetical protein